MYRFTLERDELADRLGGGLPEGSLIVIEGEYGAGKSILLQRFLYGLLKNDVSVTLVSTELTTLHFIEQMYSLDYPVEESILEHKLLFLPVYPVLGFRGRKDDMLERLLAAKKMYSFDVIAIDAFSSLLKSYLKAVGDRVDSTSKLEEALYMFKLLNARGRTIILTLEPADLQEEMASMLKAAADIYLQVRLEVVGNNVSRSLLVKRFGRAEKTVGDVVPFRVEPKVGLVVEIKSVS
ncbi:MAG TPA: ATPase domain-containing protein [Candidatus Thermoplasmatota archaeon]|jgi:archaeal flagellar protein FlaH|nr:ATPase domain-containing protein [Candidatus Thermoplasmatota archaeon]